MSKLNKIKKFLYWILVLWIPFNMLLGFMYFIFTVDLPISEKKVKFLNNMLQEIEYTYNNKDANKTFYEDSVFEIMSNDKYRKINLGINHLCNYSSKVIIKLKVSVSNRILYRDTIDKCCYGYYEVTYNPLDNTALCLYYENSKGVNIDLSRTKIIKTLKN